MDDDRKSSLPPPSEIDAMCDDDKMPDEAETTPETSGARTETPEVGEPNVNMHETIPTIFPSNLAEVRPRRFRIWTFWIQG